MLDQHAGAAGVGDPRGAHLARSGGGDAPPGMHRHEADLRLRVSDRPSLVTFGKAAYVDLGRARAAR